MLVCVSKEFWHRSTLLLTYCRFLKQFQTGAGSKLRNVPLFFAGSDLRARFRCPALLSLFLSGLITPTHLAVSHYRVSFRHDTETLQKLKRAKEKWGIVPVDILEGQAPPMLTACVREMLKERKETKSELKKQLITHLAFSLSA